VAGLGSSMLSGTRRERKSFSKQGEGHSQENRDRQSNGKGGGADPKQDVGEQQLTAAFQEQGQEDERNHAGKQQNGKHLALRGQPVGDLKGEKHIGSQHHQEQDV
jgi:hypothetical protein